MSEQKQAQSLPPDYTLAARSWQSTRTSIGRFIKRYLKLYPLPSPHRSLELNNSCL